MYFRIKDTILFRQYSEYGFLTDNSMFGYKILNSNIDMPGEKYVSESAAVMLSMLTKEPQDIETLVRKMLDIFIDVDYEELKNDTIDFFMQLVNDGYLAVGDSINECNIFDKKSIATECDIKQEAFVDECSKHIFHQDDFLRSLHIEIASECNERCLHCYIPHESKTKMINSEMFYKIVEEGRKLNIINVTLSGGEPLLHKDFVQFLKRCRELDLSVNVLSNLTLLTDEVIDEMKRNPLLCVQTSIYSMNSEIHDSITKVNGSFVKTKSATEKLIKSGIPVQISCPIMKQNKDSFSDVVKWGYDNNITVATDYVIFASLDHSNSNLANRLTFEEVQDAFESQLTCTYAQYLFDNAKDKYKMTGEDPICSICRYYLCITAEGNVFPCVGWQNKVLGNLTQSSIKEIWENSKEVKCLRKIKRSSFPQCVECDSRGYCNVCMMSNSNENADGDAFRINEFHCRVSAMMKEKVESFSGVKK